MEVITFNRAIDAFILSLEESTQSKALRDLDLLKRLGHDLRLPHSKQIQKNLFELRTKGALEVRILYTFHKNRAVLLHVFIKKSQKLPAKDLRLALQRKQALDLI